MLNPYFSILIPTYNRKNLLKETLESVFLQSCKKSYEIVVVDDGSTDGTWEFLKNLQKTKKNLVINRHEKNKGVAEARNTLLKIARGEYIIFLDSDDLLVEGALKKMEEIISKEKEKECFLFATYIVKGKKIKLKNFPELPQNPLERLKLYFQGKFSEAFYLLKKNILQNYVFHPLLKVREDWVLYGKILALNPPFIIKEPLRLTREHPQRLRKMCHYYVESVLVSVEILFQELPEEFRILLPYAKARAFMEIGSKFVQLKDYKQAFQFYKKALKCYPKILKEFKFTKKFLKSFILKYF